MDHAINLLLVVAAAAGVNPAESADATRSEGVRLLWRFQKDRPFYQESTTDSHQQMKVMGMDVNQRCKATTWCQWTPLNRDADGNWILELRCTRIRLELPGQAHDTANPAPNDPLIHLLRGRAQYTISPEQRVLKTAVMWPANNLLPFQNDLIRECFMVQPGTLFQGVPALPLCGGERWSEQSRVNLGPMGLLDTTLDLQYVAPDGPLHRFQATGRHCYHLPHPAGNPQESFRIVNAKLTFAERNRSTYWFNVARGRLERMAGELEFAGAFTIHVGGQQVPVDLKQVTKTTVTVSDDPPPAPGKPAVGRLCTY